VRTRTLVTGPAMFRCGAASVVNTSPSRASSADELELTQLEEGGS